MSQVITLDCELGEDKYLFLDASAVEGEFRSRKAKQFRATRWYGNQGDREALAMTHSGDSSLVSRSDALLSQLEDQIVHTRKWRNIDDVVGSMPNIPAFLAGTPNAMRRRVRVDRDDAPVSIFMDLTSSAGISGEQLLARGIAILAFTRLLVEHRAVELWAGIALGERTARGTHRSRSWSSTIAWKIDTQPIDLARAAHMLASPAMARGVGYGIAEAASGYEWSGEWAFGNHAGHIRTQHSRLVNAMGNRELLLVPPIYLTDPLVTDPVGWIKRELLRYTGQGGGEDA